MVKNLFILFILSFSLNPQPAPQAYELKILAIKMGPVTEGRYYFQNVLFIQKSSKAKFTA